MLRNMTKNGPLLVIVLNGLFYFGCCHRGNTTMNLNDNNNTTATDYYHSGERDANYSTTYDDYSSSFVDTPILKIKHDIFNEDQLDMVYNFYDNIEKFNANHSLIDLGLMAATVNIHTVRFIELFMHKYDRLPDLEQSFGPHIDQELCLRQLEQLNERMKLLREQKFDSKDVNLYHLLETYGRVQPGWIVDNSRWTGMYDSCLEMKIDLSSSSKIDRKEEKDRVGTRYCLASIRHHKWPRKTLFQQVVGLEVGVCLPKVCDPLSYKNKYDLILKLIDFNGRKVDEGQSILGGLYCLPDDDSPLRMWWKMPRVVVAIILVGVWLAFLIYATIRYESLKRLLTRPTEPLSYLNVSESNGSSNRKHPEDQANDSTMHSDLKFYQMFSIKQNLNILFTTNDSASTKEVRIISDSKRNGDINLVANGNRKCEHNNETDYPSSGKTIDLRCLDGIKVIAMFTFILSHVLMTISDTTTNGKYLPAFSSTSMFSVNIFFTMTGILNCYLLFLKNQTHPFIGNPMKWMTLIIYRYFRIMTVYVIIIYYSKYLSKFTGSGPLWDYGTSSLAHRRQCEQESWLRTLLFGANFKRLVENCNMSGWYVANDFQFFLITPILLMLLLKNSMSGKMFIQFCILASWLAAIYKTLVTYEPDLRGIVKTMPHTFSIHSISMNEIYMEPQYRIAAYLCGLLFGYYLFIYEQHKKNQTQQTITSSSNNNTDGHLNGVSRKFSSTTTTGWPKWFVDYGLKLSFIIITLPAILSLLPRSELMSSKFESKILAAMYIPTFHILFALASGTYILLASTGHVNNQLNNFLTASFWKPFARLSLCVALINIDVIFYLKEARKFHGHIGFIEQFAFNLLALFITYVISLIVYILFESPIGAALKHFLFGILIRK